MLFFLYFLHEAYLMIQVVFRSDYWLEYLFLLIKLKKSVINSKKIYLIGHFYPQHYLVKNTYFIINTK